MSCAGRSPRSINASSTWCISTPLFLRTMRAFDSPESRARPWLPRRDLGLDKNGAPAGRALRKPGAHRAAIGSQDKAELGGSLGLAAFGCGRRVLCIGGGLLGFLRCLRSLGGLGV